MSPALSLDRRGFLRTGAAAAGGLLIAFPWPKPAAAAVSSATLNAFVHVGSDDAVTLIIHKGEMGQGTVTSLAMLLAEELECDWKKIRTEFAPIDPAYGGFQGVVGSGSIRSSFGPLRQAGAAAREMLVQAAAARWSVDKSQCRADNSSVVNTATNARLTYGALAEDAGKLPKPVNVALKPAVQFSVIGKSRPRLDTPEKVDGRTIFGIDVRVPGMLHAVVARCPVFGGKVASFDMTRAKAVPGVKFIAQISNGVAVVADNTWSAMQGRNALQIQWDEGKTASVNSAAITRSFVEHMDQPGAVAKKDGDAEAALASAASRIEASYEVPFLAHAPMEPLNCVAHVRADACEIWAPTQMPSAAHRAGMSVTGLRADQVMVHSEYMGGGFGRRAADDYVAEAVQISKAAGVPVQVTWTREDDMQGDLYRPASYTHFRGALDGDGWPVVLHARMACPPFGGLRNGVSSTGVEGVSTMPYAIPNVLVEYHAVDPGIPVSYWRSVGYSQNTFFMESFLDELAVAGKKDPLEVRRRLLAKQPRMLAALELAAGKSGWGQPLAAGHGRGIGIVNNIGSFTVQVAEVSVVAGKLKVHRVVCAVDCGQVVNPAGVEQQIQSGIVYGLSAALKGSITIDKGRVQQGNFNHYDVLRIDEMPKVEVYLTPSSAPPSGIGEASVPGIAPAVTNAIFAATGKRIRKLPIAAAELA
jgi:isoquinoline 1-oxidoreductase beta subunit